MTRISLKEAYDNRDVVAQLVADRQDIDNINEILANLPDPDLTNVVLKTGDQTIDGKKTFNDETTFKDVIHADGGLDLNDMGPLTVNGDLEVNGDIIQNGSAYETHAEQVFSANDYIVTRDGALGSLPAGSYSGIQVKKQKATELIAESTAVIFGCHGKKYSSITYFDICEENIKQIILIGDNLALTQVCLKFYDDGECRVEAHPERAELYVE